MDSSFFFGDTCINIGPILLIYRTRSDLHFFEIIINLLKYNFKK
jgi:hypothetical protein